MRAYRAPARTPTPARRCSPSQEQVGRPENRSTVAHVLRIEGSHTVKTRDVIRLIEQDGWRLVATRGSHRQYKHPTKPGRVTVAGKPSHDIAPGTLKSILRQAGLRGEEP